MAKRVPASERRRQRIEALLSEGTEGELHSELIRLGVRRQVEEALEAESAEALGRGYYQGSGEAQGQGYRNGNRSGRLRTAEGAIEYAAPQIRYRTEPFRSRIRERLGTRSEVLEKLAVEMYARGVCRRVL